MKSLKEWCEENEGYELLAYYENAENVYPSDKIGFSAAKVVNWKCKKCGMEWQQSLNKRSGRGRKACPYCSHERPSYVYNVLTENPILTEEWDYDRNDKKPEDYLPNSHEVVWWKCKNGHSWKGVIRDRVRAVQRNQKKERPICPYCNHERVSNTYNLMTEFPNIARQWNYTKNGSLVPMEVSPKSQKKVWWICSYNPMHIWQDRISNRTALHRECPYCSKGFTISFPSRALYYYLKQYFLDCEMECKVGNKYVLDICIPSYLIAIEYDGWYYHSNKEAIQREEEKDKVLKKKGYDVIRIKEQKESSYHRIEIEKNIVKYHLQENYKNLDELIKRVVGMIQERTKMKWNQEIDIKKDYQKIEEVYYHTRKSNTIAVKYPELMQEWSSSNIRLPDTITEGSNYLAKWVCLKCHREYVASIANRTRHNSNCPFCSNRKVCKENSLASCFPEKAKEWNQEKNGILRPEDVTWGSDKMVWWKCEKGHEWQTRVYVRTGSAKSKCPYCSHRLLAKENTLAKRSFELCKLWNHEKNGEKIPLDYSYSSNQEVWWKCEKGHEWKRSINQMQRIKKKEKCPYCRKIK